MFSVKSLCFALLVSAVTCQPYFVQERTASVDVAEPVASNELVGYQIVPDGEYAVATIEPEFTWLDVVLSPITAVMELGSTALSVAFWVVINGGLVFLGMAIVIGFCALTPYCTMTIEKPAFLARENVNSIPYLQEIENFFSEAYHKYHKMQTKA